MNRPLALGPLSAEGHAILRSGVRWLCNDGHVCRPNEVIGYCNVSLERSGGRQTGPGPFVEEMEIQVGFAPRFGGRIRIATGATLGGYMDIREAKPWDPHTVIAEIETDDPAAEDRAVGQLRLLMLAGRRMTALADVHSGLLPGWLGRSRAWWGAADEVPLTVLSMGICDATSVILGDRTAFLEMFADGPEALHVVFHPDHPVAPAAPVLLDQLQRTPAQFKAIEEEVRGFMASGAVAPTADDWMFVGAVLSSLGRSPLAESYSLFTPSGSRTLPPAQAVLLSLNAEPQAILKHRRLGFRLHVMRHHQAAAGPAARAWMAQEFDVVTRAMEDIRRDYEALIDAISLQSGAKVIVLNRMSTSGYEDISNYAPFDSPMSGILANIGSKELNLMLHDIAETREMYIIDVDAIAAEIGGRDHLPDGIHQSGLMQAHLRRDLLAILETLRGAA